MKSDSMQVKIKGRKCRITLLGSSLDHCYSLRVASGIYIKLPPLVVPVTKKREKRRDTY